MSVKAQSQIKQGPAKQEEDDDNSDVKKSFNMSSETGAVEGGTKPEALPSVAKVKPFPCPQCKMRLTTEERLVKHIELKHIRPKPGIPGFPVRKHLCTICGHGFRDINRLRCHERIHNNERPFECTQCGQTCYSKEYLRRHELRHVKTRQWECQLCGNKYASALSLKEHVRNHTGERPFECKLCDSTFNRKSSLRNHIKLLHIGNVKLPFSCTVCDKQFRKQPELTVHLRIHTNEKPFICAHCGNKFRTKQAMQKHEQTHTELEVRSSCECKYCDKKLCSTMSLSRHVLTVHPEHVNNAKKLRYVCNVCNKVFPGRACLNLHSVVHTGVRPFACAQCNKCFNRKANLRTHELTHIQSKEVRFSAKPSGDGEKPFACSHCDKRFDKNWNLRVHELRHTSPNDISQSSVSEIRNTDQAVSNVNVLNRTPLVSERMQSKDVSKLNVLKSENYDEQKEFVEYKPDRPSLYDATYRSSSDMPSHYITAVSSLQDTDASSELICYEDDDNDNDISDLSNDDIKNSYQFGVKMDIFDGNHDTNTSRYAELKTINKSDHTKFVSSSYIGASSREMYDARGLANQSVYQTNKIQQYSSMNNVSEYPENLIRSHSEASAVPVKITSLNDNLLNNFASKPVVPVSLWQSLSRKTENEKFLPVAQGESLSRKSENRMLQVTGSVKHKTAKQGFQCRDCKKWFKRRTQLESHGRLRKHNVQS